MDEQVLLKRITVNPKIFGGKPIIYVRRLAVEHILGMLAQGIRLKRSCRGIPGWKKKTFKLALFTRGVRRETERIEKAILGRSSSGQSKAT